MLKMLITIILILSFLALGGYYYFTSHQESYSGNINHPGKTLVLFDFDGTIVDSLDAAMDAFNQVVPSFNLTPVKTGEARIYRTMSSRDFLTSHGVTSWKLPLVVYRMKQILRPTMPTLQPFPGVMDTLDTLKAQGVVVGILTSNSLENVQTFLQKHNLDHFDFVFHGSSLFGKDRLINLIKKESGVAGVYYVGDEVRDIEACKSAGVPIIAVTWGYHAKEMLEPKNPEYMVDSYTDLQILFASLKLS